nr:hypothetical protein [Tanacetum cinerariifolium]
GGGRFAGRKRLAHLLGSDIGSKQDNGVGEVALAAQAVVQFALVQDLQKDVEHRRVRLFNLVKQDHRIRLLPDFIDQQAALLVAHVAGRRAVEQGRRVLLLKLRHIEANQERLIVEQKVGQRFSQLRFARAGGP